MMAECYANLEDSDNCMRCLNLIRARAGVDPITNFTGYEDLLVTIRAERARELGGEFMRKFDLVRWGNWYQRVMEYNDYDALKNNVRACHEYYPIPDTEVALSDGKLDNKAYEQGL
jgi:hypothetical protein